MTQVLTIATVVLAVAVLLGVWRIARARGPRIVTAVPTAKPAPAAAARASTATHGRERADASRPEASRTATERPKSQSAEPPPRVHGVDEQLALVDARLWHCAFELPPPLANVATAGSLQRSPIDDRVREGVRASLDSAELAARHFPRRPLLMPQLLQAVNDPNAAPGKLAAIVSQDPVVTGDVLRLANSAFHRSSTEPVESLQRAIIVCGTDGLSSLVATALMQPVFRSSKSAFPRFPALLWERTARASLAAELYAGATQPADRLPSQLVTLLAALGPLVVYRLALDQYTQLRTAPRAEVVLDLLREFGPTVASRVAKDWSSSDRFVAAMDPAAASSREPGVKSLVAARAIGEFLGGLSLLREMKLLTDDECTQSIAAAALRPDVTAPIWDRLRGED